MKKQIFLSFLAGLLVPLVLAALFQENPGPADVERGTVTVTEPARRDAAEELTVLNFGHVLRQGKTSDVLHDPEVIKAYLGE